MKRYTRKDVTEDLQEKMVFIGGPRQVGKTTLALSLLADGSERHPAYLNWDDVNARTTLLQGALPANEPLIILDEIHKYKGWRNLIKGLYDVNKSHRRLLVTGSARLDHYRRGGDSLQGRYHYWRLHPLSLYELNATPNPGDMERLLRFGGFPEPFIKADERHWKRWQRERQTRVIHEDLIGLEQVKEVSQLDLLAQLLPGKVGSLLSINNLSRDLSASFPATDRWITILENLYYCYRIAPFGPPRLRALKKEKKLYLWDWSLCGNAPARFENLVASNLLKYCHYHEDHDGDRMELRFVRDTAGRELDFVVMRNNRPEFAVECKTGPGNLSKNITYFSSRAGIPYHYQVHTGARDIEYPAVRARILPLVRLVEIIKV